MSDDPEIYKPEEVRAALSACSDTPTGLRDAAIVFTLWCTGLRCAEMCDLMPGDIDRSQGTVWVRSGKGGKSRTIVTPASSRSELWERIDAWISARKAHAWTDSTLFCNLHGGRLDPSSVRKSLGRLAATAELTCRFHPHGLRHTFASTMHLAGVPLSVIQRQLGHSDLAITGRYLRRIGAEALDQAMADFDLE